MAKNNSENAVLSAKEIDKQRKNAENKKKEKVKEKVEKRKIKKTTIATLPYEKVESEYIIRVESNVKVGKQTVNLYSKTYVVSDINYSSSTRDEQEKMFQVYMELLNGFDESATLQITINNAKINKKDFENKILLKKQDDNFDEYRDEFNRILHDKLILGQNGLQCTKYFTVTVAAVDYQTATQRFINYEQHLNICLKKLDTEITALKANERMQILNGIFRDINSEILPISPEEFNRGAEKMLICPDYFEFKKDYFMFDRKFARCVYVKKLGSSVKDEIFKDLVEQNISMIITHNTEVVDPVKAVTNVRKQITDMKMEKNKKVKTSAIANGGVIVGDPIEGTKLSEDLQNATELLDDLRSRNQKMLLNQFIIMLAEESLEELDSVTEKVRILLRKHSMQMSTAPYQQEQCLSSVLPLGNSSTFQKNTLKVRRTLSTESTAIFMPFNARQINHEGGMYYGLNQMTNNIIYFNRRNLKNPNGFIFGLPGSGKSFAAKLEIINAILSTNDEILIIDPEREYTLLTEKFGGEVIKLSENSKNHINPLELTENPDPTDTDYSPIKAKHEFFLSFFSTILNNKEIKPNQKTIIDICLHQVYKDFEGKETPTLKDYYKVLKRYSEENEGEIKREAAYLCQALYLYVHGSMDNFSHASTVNINKRIVDYDIKELGNNLKPLGMMIVLENIWDRIAKNRVRGIGTRIYIDEMYLMFKSEQCANFFYELYKRARNWGGIPTGITQNVEDLLSSNTARSMLSNTEFILMLCQNSTDSIMLADVLKIPEDTMRFVTKSSSGSGLMHAGKFGELPFINDFPRDTELYKIMSTSFEETAEQLQKKAKKT